MQSLKIASLSHKRVKQNSLFSGNQPVYRYRLIVGKLIDIITSTADIISSSDKTYSRTDSKTHFGGFRPQMTQMIHRYYRQYYL